MGVVHAHTFVHTWKQDVGCPALSLTALLLRDRVSHRRLANLSPPPVPCSSLSAGVAGLFGTMPNFLCGLWRFELRSPRLLSKLSQPLSHPKARKNKFRPCPKSNAIDSFLCSCFLHVQLPVLWGEPLCEAAKASPGRQPVAG